MASELRLECKFQMAEMEEQLRQLRAKLEAMERLMALAPPVKAAVAPVPVPVPAVEPGIPEETLLAISAAVAAFLGKRAHIRQLRLVSSAAWAQQGRASVQASHGIVVQR